MKLDLTDVILDTTKLVENMKEKDLNYLKHFEKVMKEQLEELQRDYDKIHREVYEREWRIDAIISSCDLEDEKIKSRIEDIENGKY
ncbi:hypothetical protein UT300009_30510 [Paraclostridium bifermentans]